MRLPVGARRWASVPPPAPVPMMITSWCSMGTSSDEGDRAGPGAGGAPQPGVGEDEREAAHAVGRERRQVEVLDDEDAVADVEEERDLERLLLGRHRAVAPGVAAGERDAVLDQPAGHRHARPGLAGQVGLGVVPVPAPAGVEEDRVARRRVDAAEVLHADDVAGPAAGHVDEPAARDDLRDRLRSEPLDAGVAGELLDGPAVVAAAADLQVGERVEMGAELLRAGDDLGDPVAGRMVGGRDERLAEVAPGEDGHALVQHVAEVVEPPLAHVREGGGAPRVGDVVEHPALIVGAEGRGPPLVGHPGTDGRPRGALRVTRGRAGGLGAMAQIPLSPTPVSALRDATGSLPIASYAMLSDCNSAALVGADGSVDWLCLPRFDSAAVFSRLLDPAAGHWSITPVEEFAVSRRYREGSLVLETTFTTESGAVTVTDALAFAPGQRGHALGMDAPHELLRLVTGVEGRVELTMELAPRPEYGLVQPLFRATDDGGRTFGGPNPVSIRAAVPTTVTGSTMHARFSVEAGEEAGFAMRWAPPEAPAIPVAAPADVAARIAETAEAWRSWEAEHAIY